MHFNVSQLMREPSGAYRVYEVDEHFPSLEDTEARRVAGIVKLLRTDKGVWVSAGLDTQEPCTCSRCLEQYHETVHIIIEEETFPLRDPDTGASLKDLDDTGTGESFNIDESHILDLTETVRQYAALNVPMKPVCRQECKGMCLTCGVNLNDSTCRCDSVVRDSRWGELRDLVASTESTKELNN